MLGSYWDKARQIGQAVKEFGKKSVRQIATAAGVSKSAAHRHLKAAMKRNKHPESGLWESVEGQLWLVRLVSATIFYFGIQRGVGAETISEFFKEIRIDTHVGVSPTAIRTKRKEIEHLIIEYAEKYQKEALANCDKLEVIGGVDEKFFNEMMILLMMDLPTGFILSEKAAKDRKYETWKEQLESALENMPVKVRYLVSDRAQALIKLATKHFECKSIADLFHPLHKIAQIFSLSLHSKINGCLGELEKIEKKLAKLSINQDSPRMALEEKRKQIQNTLNDLQESLNKYRELLHQFSLTVHPFQTEQAGAQSSQEVETQLRKIVNGLQILAKKHELNYQKKLKSVKNQLSDIASLMDIWWDWVNNSLSELVTDPIIQQWAKNKLLPVVYWKNQIGKSDSIKIDQVYQEAYQKALVNLSNDPTTTTIDPEMRQKLDKWADLMVKRFCRSTSAVEGRNGTLSQLNHCRRGFKKDQLPVLTGLHNFYIRRADGTTAAERFFDQEFPDLFEWFLPQIESLPRPRASRLQAAV